MTEKENAQKLYTRYYNQIQSTGEELGMEIIVNFLAKECAIIAADEIIEVTAPNCDRYEPYYLELKAEMTQKYWQDVKKEIEKL